jgi:DnaJ family protein C protein 9
LRNTAGLLGYDQRIIPNLFQESLILADTENETRIRDLVASLFTSGELSPTPAWKKTTTKTAIKNRASASASEALEAEQHAKDLGIHDKLFAKDGEKTKESEEEKLMALMKANSERRMGALISNLETKYGAGAAKSGKRAKKAKVDESEEENMDEEEVPKKRKTKAR